MYDMHGNVFEWCQDRYGHYGSLKKVIDPTDPAQEKYRMLRGGAFDAQPVLIRAAGRSNLQPVKRYHVTGFRVARTYILSP